MGPRINQQPGCVGDAQHRELLVGEKRWRVALGATGDERPEDIEPRDLVFVKRRMVTMRIQVVAAIERDQRTLEGGDRGIDLARESGEDPKASSNKLG